jgi:hypothetical protein
MRCLSAGLSTVILAAVCASAASPGQESAPPPALVCLVFLCLLAVAEYVGLMVPYFGWIMYVFAQPLCGGVWWGYKPLGIALLGVHLVGFPILKRHPRFQNIDPGKRPGDYLNDFAGFIWRDFILRLMDPRNWF